MGGGTGQAGGSLVGSIVGGIVGGLLSGGSPVGVAIGASIGGAAGGYAGSQVDMALAGPVQGPRLGDVQISTSTYGLPIPRAWGTVRLPGNLIWTSGITEVATEQNGKKGKGKSGPGMTTFSYECSFAFAFALGPADRILRIWADGKPVFDANPAPIAPGEESLENDWGTSNPLGEGLLPFRFHGGTEEQLPDPLLEEWAEAKGFGGQMPAYRGLCYIVCENVPLQAYGNRIPNISAEISFAGAPAATLRTLEAIPADEGGVPDGFSAAYGAAYDGVRGVGYGSGFAPVGHAGYGAASAVVTFSPALPMRESSVVPLAEIMGGLAPGAPRTGPLAGMGAGEGSLLYLWLDTDTLAAVDPVTKRAVSAWQAADSGLSLGARTISKVLVLRMLTAYGPRDVVVSADKWNGDAMVHLGPLAGLAGGASYGALGYLWGAGEGTRLATAHHAWGGLWRNASLAGGRQGEGFCEAWFVSWLGEATVNETVEVWLLRITEAGVAPSHVASLRYDAVFDQDGVNGLVAVLGNYDRANDQLLLHCRATGVSGIARVVALGRDGGLRWVVDEPAAAPPNASPASWGLSRLMGSAYGYYANGRLVQLDTRTGGLLKDLAAPSAGGFHPDLQAWDSVTGFLWGNPAGIGLGRYFLSAGSSGGVTLERVVLDVCAACGLDEADIDATQLAGDTVRGFLSPVEPGRGAIAALSQLFFFDLRESEDRLVFVKRGQDAAPAASIPFAKLLRNGGEPALRPMRQQAWEVPMAVAVRHPDIEKAHLQGTARVTRTQRPVEVQVVESVGELNVDTRLVMTAAEAKTMAKRQLLLRWFERDRYEELGLGPEYLGLEPADVVELGLHDGDAVRLRLDRVSVGADFTLRVGGVVEDATLAQTEAVAADGGSGYLRGALPTPYAVVPQLFALPLLRDQDDTAGAGMRLYQAASAHEGQVFRGAQFLQASAPATADYGKLGAAVRSGAAWGVAQAVLGPPADPGVTDWTNVLYVSMAQGAERIHSATREQVLAGANACALANGLGQAEVLQFTTATDLGHGRFRLEGLLRGRRGTEWACGLHGTADNFLLLEPAALVPAVVGLEHLNAPRWVKAMGLFDAIDLVPPLPFVFAGEAEKPYAPSNIRGARDGSDNLTLTWIRRSRIGGEWTEPEAVPLGEQEELYRLEILAGDGTTVLRTIVGLTAATTVYSAAEQSTDGLTPGDPVTLRVAQVSATVGPGHYATATV